MEAVSEQKQRCYLYSERLIEVRRKLSDFLGVNLTLETSIKDNGLEAKLFGAPRSDEKLYEMTKITITSEKKCFASTDQNRIPGNEKYADAFSSKSLKYRLSQKPIIGRLLFRKEKERIDRINQAIATALNE
ncbi:MAG: hypothetical protein ABSD68_04335 [Candidatus Micrarchaeales archaeon]|jgi:hypothetical protein